MASVWELAAAEVLPQLDAGLADYFGALPDGKVGLGRGSFQQVGTPRRWLWPVLWLLAREGIVFPVWQQRVPFEVCNRPGHDHRGRATLSATRTFHFRNGSKVMPDSIAVEADGSLTDYLGKHGWLAVLLTVEARGGAMRLTGSRVRLRVPWGWLRIPAAVSPGVQITERFDAEIGRQQVSMRLSQPQLGLLYEYRGDFGYRWADSLDSPDSLD
ncbi:MAG: DUF4166 domain-containing protein [Renibacterium sp.]|nr:DUF4166 domain-containing protein [Renibacterium sp.]